MNDLKKIALVSLIISVVVALVTLSVNGFNLEQILTIKWWAIAYLYCFFLTYLNSLYFNIINHKFEWKNKGLQRVLIGAGGSIIITMVGYTICQFIVAVIILKTQKSSEFITNQSFKDYIFPLLLTIIASLFFHLIYFYRALQEKKVTEQKIIASTASAKFTALKNQLDPHFLFNSLNVLTSLIEENPKLAQKFTTSLSKVYRYVLEQKDKELVTVDEELNFARTYMTLIKLRFEDSILFEIPQKASNPTARVVPLSLQILLENTVKHNIVMPQKPLHIKIYEKDNFLIVENNLQPKKIIKHSSGVGLVNVQQRYALLTKRKFSVYKTNHSFIAELPMLTKKIQIEDSTIPLNIEEIKNLKYQRAKERVKKIKEFYGSLTAYCIVIPFLIFINYKTNGFNFPWFFFPLAGWGIGLIFHASDAFGFHILGKDWEKKKLQKYMEESKPK
ncbi:2TM domain-containing protein [Aquimarina muelleri]|uniref:Histidine kinase n=1 Tax=Aquimarina muelleri TaxID=279356 RepID=A0A918JYZ5_9FLAO|nr:2TM domain-containing protein [Aquimarina muelleri]MCX2764180.1 2TM domain-containing protein [Aquimarina muelleri]GGX31726.1 histidine kinase [Aquimarina muelleri]